MAGSTVAALPVPGDHVRMVAARATLRVGDRLGEGAQGVVHRAVLPSGSAVAVKWYRPANDTPEQRRAIAALVAHGRPHHTYLWPIDLVTSDRIEGFGYVMPLRAARFVSFAQMLSAPRQPSFRTLARIGRELVDAFAALHFGGLSYRDVSFGNLFVDPERADVAICDNDNVGIDNAHVAVYGTLRFMAPEIVRHEAVPTTITDLHSLAVLLYYLFVHGHPLDGLRVMGEWPGDASESEMSVLHYGTDPLFVFDPVDGSNRPPPGDLMVVWWGIYPKFLRTLFTRAFTTGLHDASLSGRITDGVWRKALLRLCDSVITCPTRGAERFYDPDEPGAPCWNCSATAPVPPFLEVPGASIVMSAGAVVTSHHIRRDRDHRTIVASVDRHPEQPGELVLRNCSTAPWTVRPFGEPADVVTPGQRVHIRPMTIDFGPTTGTVGSPAAVDAPTRVWRQPLLPPRPARSDRRPLG